MSFSSTSPNTSLVGALQPTCGIMELQAWHGPDLQVSEGQNHLRQKGTLWVGQGWGGMEKFIQEPKAWQRCGQKGQTEGQCPGKSSFSIFRTLKNRSFFPASLAHMPGADGGTLGLMVRKEQVRLWVKIMVRVRGLGPYHRPGNTWSCFMASSQLC